MNAFRNTLAAAATLVCLLAPSRSTLAGDASYYWLFDQNHVSGAAVKARAGGVTAKTVGQVELRIHATPQHLQLEGKNGYVLVADNLADARLPQNRITAEAWVTVDRPSRWGGIVGALQDNGEFEHGWLLGFQNSQFSFAMAGKDKSNMTYLAGGPNFEPGRWHHVVGTYDGASMGLYVDGMRVASSQAQSGAISYPPNAKHVIGAYVDDDEFYPMAGRIREVLLYDRSLSEAEVRARHEATKSFYPEGVTAERPLELAHGPFVEWLGPGSIRVNWSTAAEVESLLEFGPKEGVPTRHAGGKGTRHAVELDALRPNTPHTFRIVAKGTGGAELVSKPYRFDSTFDYNLPPLPSRPSPFQDDAAGRLYAGAVERILKEAGTRQGYCLILGAGDGRLAWEVARRSDMKVVVVERDAQRADRARRLLDKGGVYGVRVAVQHAAGADLPFGSYLANLILSEAAMAGETPDWDAEEIHRCLRPNGGLLMVGQPSAAPGKSLGKEALAKWMAPLEKRGAALKSEGGLWAELRRAPLAGAGEWTHQYGSSDNSACSQDELAGGEMSVLWWGEPGPRPMPDRGPRNPAAVSANGRMYVQGDRVLFGMDAYNGTILWSLQAPEVRRANVVRDSSNMVASEDYLYVANAGHVTGINGQTGARELKFEVPVSDAPGSHDWGYLGVHGDTLVGSATKKGAAYLGDDGEWYDGMTTNELSLVVSDAVFGMDRHTGKTTWTYSGGTVINSTITVANDTVYFVESRNAAAKESSSGRLNREVYKEQALVAVDLRTGAKRWEKAVDFGKAERMLYLAHSKETLTVVGSSEKDYHLWAFDAPAPAQAAKDDARVPLATAGNQLWEQHYPMARDHHGGALQHPLIVGDTLYSEMRSFDLRTGKQLRTDLPERRGCGTMTASNKAFFFRHHFHGMWDLETDKRVQFEGIRGGCWIGMVPSGGLVLAPETSAGCSCTHSIQTSLAYIPKAQLAK